MDTRRKNIIVYRNHLLRTSETFIKFQSESLTQFTPYYVGTRWIKELPLPGDRLLVINRGNPLGKIHEFCSTSLRFSTNFLQQIRSVQPQLLHAHFAHDAVTALPIVRALNLPFIVTLHGFDVTVKDEFVENALVPRKYLSHRNQLKNAATLFIAVSAFIKHKALEQGFPSDRILVHYVGIDPDRFHPHPEIKRQPIVLFVGRLVEKKGCEYLLKAMAFVQAQMPEAQLIVIGDGPLRVSLETFAKGHLKRCLFLGIQTPDEIQAWMQRAKVFCVPSITAQSGDAEGFGMVFAEAQASGLPVVSSNSGGIPEAVADGQTGFLLPEKDIQGLATQILRLLQDQELWHRFSEEGQQHVRIHFNLRRQTRFLEEIYTESINQKQPILSQNVI